MTAVTFTIRSTGRFRSIVVTLHRSHRPSILEQTPLQRMLTFPAAISLVDMLLGLEGERVCAGAADEIALTHSHKLMAPF
jgi:hypothetical protein